MTEDQANDLLDLFQKLINKLDEHKVQVAILDETLTNKINDLCDTIRELKS